MPDFVAIPAYGARWQALHNSESIYTQMTHKAKILTNKIPS